MRTIYKYISFALMAFAVVACHTNEIDNPDNPDNPNPPQISDNVTFTASIKQTRVVYTHNGDKLDQRWKKDDVIYGFYGDGDGSKIALLVTEVDDNDGYATLKPLPLIGGDEFVAALKECIKKEELLSFGLIYTGKTGSTDTTEKELYNNDEIYVNMRNQSTGQIPACMESTSYEIDESNNGDTIINFKFENRCAILEIKEITGFKESTDLSEDGPTELDYINVSNVINVITYSYHNGAPGLGTDGTYKETGVKVLGSIYVDSNGNIVDSNGNSKSVMMAVAPNEKKEDIIVSAETSNDTFVASYNTDLVAGNCYVIRQQDVVAKTEDGFFFTTVNAAFSHAAELSGDSSGNYNTAAKNVVTLVRDCGIAGVTKNGNTYNSNVGVSSPLLINGYDVTLDLNGHVLSLAGNNEFFGVNRKTTDDTKDSDILNKFIITDSKGKKADGMYDGKIMSSSGNYIVRNLGKLQIDGGTFQHEGDWSVVKNFGSGQLTITEGDFYSKEYYTIVNDGVVTISNGNFSGGKFYDDGWEAVILNSGTLTVNGGTFSSKDVYTISNDFFGTLIIAGGEISSTNKSALYTVGNVNIRGGEISSTNEYALYTVGTVNIVNISGGEISSANNFAVYALGGTVNISQGNKEPCEISSTASNAGVILYNNTGGTISGGTIKNSKAKSTVSVTGGSTLVVDGGKIICTGSGSAIECMGDGKGNDPTLTVKWPSEPENTVYDRPDNVNEPLLYSASTAPVFENSSYSNSCGIVYIEGGFLYDASDSAFYKADNNYHSLKSTSGYFFYSNTAEISNETAVKADNTSLVSKDSDESITIKYTDHGISGLGDLKFTQKIEIVENQD